MDSFSISLSCCCSSRSHCSSQCVKPPLSPWTEESRDNHHHTHDIHMYTSHTLTHPLTHSHTYSHAHTHTHTYIRTYTHSLTHSLTLTHTLSLNTHTHTHTHTHTCSNITSIPSEGLVLWCHASIHASNSRIRSSFKTAPSFLSL